MTIIKVITFPFRLVLAVAIIIISAIMIIIGLCIYLIYAVTSLILSKLVFLFALVLICYLVAMFIVNSAGGAFTDNIPVVLFIVGLILFSVYMPTILDKIGILIFHGATELWLLAAKVIMM